MRERRPRPPHLRTFRHEVVEDDADGADATAEGGAPLVVHVHVHRDANGRIVANAQEEAEVVEAPLRQRRPAPRPTLTGKLFDWKEHYDLVAKRHVEAGLGPPTLWEALRASLQGRAPFVSKRSRRG